MSAMLEAIPLESDSWQSSLDVVVVPMSLEQFWDAFWSDDAPYYLPARPRDEEDELLNYTNWGTPSPGFERELNKEVRKERIIDKNLRIRGNRFAKHVHSVQYISLVEKTGTHITIKMTNVNDGAPYVEDFQTWVKWEMITPDYRSNQVAIRSSFNIHWKKKPFAIAGYVENSAITGIKGDNEGLPEYFLSNSENYLAGPPYENAVALGLV